MPQSQSSLRGSVRTEFRGGFLESLQLRWIRAGELPSYEVLFDWEDKSALMDEIAFVNHARERIDETAVKIAPSMLRIVLTVKQHIGEPRAQRAFLAEHVDWDFRRISELCIVADSYALLQPEHRAAGEAEIGRYGWSNALKLAYVRDPQARAEIWECARNGAERASYRAVLEELRRYRERKLVGPPAPLAAVHERLDAVRRDFAALETLSGELATPEHLGQALDTVGRLQKELGRLKRALAERREAAETESLAANA